MPMGQSFVKTETPTLTPVVTETFLSYVVRSSSSTSTRSFVVCEHGGGDPVPEVADLLTGGNSE